MGYYYKSAQELTFEQRRRLIVLAKAHMHTESLASAILGELEDAYPTDDCQMLLAIDELALRIVDHCNPSAESMVRAMAETRFELQRKPMDPPQYETRLVGKDHPVPTMFVHKDCDWADALQYALKQPIQLVPAEDCASTEGAVLSPASDGAECDQWNDPAQREQLEQKMDAAMASHRLEAETRAELSAPLEADQADDDWCRGSGNVE